MKAVVCGGGRVGSQIARHLSLEKADVTVIDAAEGRVRDIVAEMDVTGVVGSASEAAVLERAGAEDADILIAATRADEVNLMSCQLAGSVFSVPQKIARLRSPGYLDRRWQKIFDSGELPVDEIIYPEQDVANSIVRWLDVPMATEAVHFLGGKVQFVGLRIGEDCPVAGQPLRQLSELFEGLRTMVLASQRGQGLQILSGDDVVEAGDIVRFVVEPDELARTLPLFGFRTDAVQQLAVVGGGHVGSAVAEAAAGKGIRTRLLETDARRARRLAERLPGIQVILGDALNPAVLEEANVSSSGVLVAVTDDDRTNLLISALAKERGARHVLALNSNPAFGLIADRLSVDATVNPRTATISAIISHLRRGSVQALHSLQDGHATLIEARVVESSTVAGKRLRDSLFPDRSRIGAVLGKGGNLKDIRGDLQLENGDRVLLLADDRDARRIESLFRAGLSYF